jgi:rod shape-determining protein MreC
MSLKPQKNIHQKTILETLPMRLITTRITPVVLILLCLTMIAFHKIDTQPIEKMQAAVGDVMAPALSAISRPFSSAIDSIDGMTSIRALKAENIRLTEENEKLQKWYEQALRLQAENKSFRELLNVRAEPDIRTVTARIVSDPGGAFVKSVLLAVGKKDGVHKGNAVMSGNGLVGRVTEAGARSARVLLLTDLNSRIPVVIQNTRTKAILAGKNTELLKLERLPIDSGVTVGQRIVTSGDGGLLPADIPVGIIVSADADGVMVKPLADTARATYVQVIDFGMDPSLENGDIIPASPE